MIYFLLCGRHRFTLGEYRLTWAKHLASEIEVIHYESMGTRRHWPAGTYVFTDLERLIPVEMRASQRLAQRFSEHPDRYRVLNDPRRVLLRFKLLESLHRKGINGFNVHRVGTLTDAIRFPVFLKRAYEHSIKGIELLHNEAELKGALRRLGPMDRLRKDGLMITEYCDVANEQGQFRKYSAMRLGQSVVPRHILLSDRWLTKKPDLITAEHCAEEADYVASGQAHEGIESAFTIGGIDYGRIDYGLLDGKVQVWEINTNPRLVPPPDCIDPKRHDSQADSARQINAALTELNTPMAGDGIEVDAKQLGLWRDPVRRLFYKQYGKHLRR